MATTKPLSSAKYNNIYVTLIPHIPIIGFYYFDKSINTNEQGPIALINSFCFKVNIMIIITKVISAISLLVTIDIPLFMVYQKYYC